MKRFGLVFVLLSCCVFLFQSAVLLAEGEPTKDYPAGMAKLEESRKKIEQLTKEKGDLIQQGASAQLVQAKEDEIINEKRSAAQLLGKSFPYGIPNPNMALPPPQQFQFSKLSAADQAELKTLVTQRRKMVVGGATHKDIQALTERIQKLYQTGFPPVALPPPPRPSGAAPQSPKIADLNVPHTQLASTKKAS